MKEFRSQAIFWPILLIAVGAVWLLDNLNLIPGFNFGLLLSLWPLLLIVGGLNLIIGRRLPLLRAFITLAAVAVALLWVFFAPSLGLVTTPEVQEASLSEPIGDASSATVTINSSVGQAIVTPLVDSSDLIQADIRYVGDLTFNVTGTTEKVVDLSVDTDALDTDIYNFLDENELLWDIGLTPDIPLEIAFSGGVGEVELDLTGLTLSEVHVDGGVGDFEIFLPALEGLYSVRVDGGVGSFKLHLEDGAEVELDLSSGVGEFVIELPDDAGVELRADLGVGSIRVPSNFVEIGEFESGIGGSGFWESENFETAEYFIFIEYDGGVGDLRIR